MSASRWIGRTFRPPVCDPSLFFRHGEGLRSVDPDAFGILGMGGETFPFFLEWERRAVRPVTMARRLAPYLHYYSSRRPFDDHGVEPLILVVLEDELAAVHFLRVAQSEIGRAGVEVPLRVSHQSALERVGPLGPGWRSIEAEQLICTFALSSPALN